MADNWYRGNATQDGDQHRGWLLGHFVDPAVHGIRHTGDLEVKWGIHPAASTAPAAGSPAKREPRVAWGPGIEHTWQALTDSTMLTIRWPSI